MRKEKLWWERTSKFWKMYLNQSDDVWGCADLFCPATESAPESSSTLKRAVNQLVLHQWDYLTEASIRPIVLQISDGPKDYQFLKEKSSVHSVPPHSTAEGLLFLLRLKLFKFSFEILAFFFYFSPSMPPPPPHTHTKLNRPSNWSLQEGNKCSKCDPSNQPNLIIRGNLFGPTPC